MYGNVIVHFYSSLMSAMQFRRVYMTKVGKLIVLRDSFLFDLGYVCENRFIWNYSLSYKYALLFAML